MNKQQLRDIVKADNARRAQRQIVEDAILGIGTEPDTLSDAYKVAHAPLHATANRVLVRGIGVVTALDCRVSERWQRTPYIVRAAGEFVTVTHPDGSQEQRSASSFRKHNTRTAKKVSTATVTPETARIKLDHDFNS